MDCSLGVVFGLIAGVVIGGVWVAYQVGAGD